MKQLWASLKKFPIIPLFFGFLMVFSIADMFTPDQAMSELENRALNQAPDFNFSSFTDNEWTKLYGEYTRDQFLFRDEWISLQSMLETAQGKLENGGVWYADDGYQIAKDEVLSAAQQRMLPINTEAVCQLAQRYPGKVQVMIVPSAANILSDMLPWDPPQIDENAYLNDIFSAVTAAGGSVIDLRENFLSHSDEQLYYRTDHHWTTDGGAWLAYAAFCETQGLGPVQPPPALRVDVPDFYGTNYAKSKHFGTQPDTMVYYDLPNSMTIYQYEDDGSLTTETSGIMDEDKLFTFDKYGAFLHGNNGYSEISGDGTGNVLLIKDSYGNCFAPYLAANYDTVGVMDLRAWYDVDTTVAEGDFDTILVLYSFDSFSQDAYANRMGTQG